MNKTNLKHRFLTALFGGSLLILSTFHELSYLLAFVVIIFLSSREYYRILKQNNYRPNDILGVFLSVLIFITSYLYSSNGEMWGIYFILIPILPIVCLSALYSSKSKDAAMVMASRFTNPNLNPHICRYLEIRLQEEQQKYEKDKLRRYKIFERLRNGAEKFKGEHIHFGTERFPDWQSVCEYLL